MPWGLQLLLPLSARVLELVSSAGNFALNANSFYWNLVRCIVWYSISSKSCFRWKKHHYKQNIACDFRRICCAVLKRYAIQSTVGMLMKNGQLHGQIPLWCSDNIKLFAGIIDSCIKRVSVSIQKGVLLRKLVCKFCHWSQRNTDVNSTTRHGGHVCIVQCRQPFLTYDNRCINRESSDS